MRDYYTLFLLYDARDMREIFQAYFTPLEKAPFSQRSAVGAFVLIPILHMPCHRSSPMTSATIPRAAARIPHIKNKPVHMLIFSSFYSLSHTLFFIIHVLTEYVKIF